MSCANWLTSCSSWDRSSTLSLLPYLLSEEEGEAAAEILLLLLLLLRGLQKCADGRCRPGKELILTGGRDTPTDRCSRPCIVAFGEGV